MSAYDALIRFSETPEEKYQQLKQSYAPLEDPSMLRVSIQHAVNNAEILDVYFGMSYAFWLQVQKLFEQDPDQKPEPVEEESEYEGYFTPPASQFLSESGWYPISNDSLPSDPKKIELGIKEGFIRKRVKK